MPNIGVRSPYFIYAGPQSGGNSAVMTLTIDSTNVYTITKETGTEFLVDIADIVRDFVNPTYDGTLDLDSIGEVPVTTSVQFYDTNLVTVGSPYTQSHTAFDAYNYFQEGNNCQIDDSINLISGSTIWAPENTAGSFYATSALGAVSVVGYTTSATSQGGVTIKRFPCTKYDPVKCVFVNKLGVPQELYFFGKTIESTTSQREQYKANIVGSNGASSVYAHQKRSFEINGTTRYTLNTGFVDESYTEYVRELMLSENVWLVIDSVVRPVTPLSSEVTFRTSLNDKLIEYTVEFEQSNDLISSVR
jgi:hypothetical protein